MLKPQLNFIRKNKSPNLALKKLYINTFGAFLDLDWVDSQCLNLTNIFFYTEGVILSILVLGMYIILMSIVLSFKILSFTKYQKVLLGGHLKRKYAYSHLRGNAS